MSTDETCRPEEGLEPLLEVLGHRFRRPELLWRALTHPSAAGNGAREYQRLEFLGDRVLGLIVAELLMQHFPAAAEGSLSMRSVALVRAETLADVAVEIGLGKHLILAKGEDEAGGRTNPALLADACEAVIAALYLDGGLEAAAGFVKAYWSPRLTAPAEPPRDAKTLLQEWAQARGKPLPEYRTVARAGPPHSPTFTVEARVEGLPPARAAGPSKRIAEQAAAGLLLDAAGEGDG